MLNLTRRRLIYASIASLLGVGLGMGFIETRRVEVTRVDMGIGAKVAFLTDTYQHVRRHSRRNYQVSR